MVTGKGLKECFFLGNGQGPGDELFPRALCSLTVPAFQ